MRVQEIMTPEPVAIGIGTSIGRAWEILRDLDVRHLPVVDGDNVLVGMVSERDFGRPPAPRLMNDVMGAPSFHLDAPVARIMSRDPISVTVSADVDDAVELLLDHKVGAVAVVTSRGRLAGILSYVDILRLQSERGV
jgi:acetoin utilization protein AcuB